jgi:starch synthase
MKIFFVCAEVAPFAAVGGLSQFMYFLPKAFMKLGAEVSIFMPKYGTIDEEKYHIKPYLKAIKISTDEAEGVRELVCNVKIREGGKREPTVYFLENMEYFEKRANVYGYNDDHVRFALLSRGALEFIKASAVRPNIIHCNDWHTGYLSNLLRTTYADDPVFRSVSTVYTIHNLANQGLYDFRFASPLNYDDGKSHLAGFFSTHFTKQNAMKRGIIYADLVNTVSETYAREIMTPEYGEGLQDLIREVQTKVFGVLNGIDYTDFDPATDNIIKKNFSWKNILVRKENKTELQKLFNLKPDPSVPILAISGRLTKQKGLDLLIEILPTLLAEFDVQFVTLGNGELIYREFFQKLEADYPGRVGTYLMSNWELPRKIFSGADMLLLPSRFEPGGIVVIEGMRYGAVPVVRHTGGLADIVTEYDPEQGTGNGFMFKNYSSLSLYGAIVRSLQIYKNKKAWDGIVSRAMREDFSWDAAAKKYMNLYDRATEFRKDRLSPIVNISRITQMNES